MKIYIKDGAFSTKQFDETWIETEDEIVETPLGMQLKSYTLTPEYAERIRKIEIRSQITALKEEIAKIKEDVEQVELFGMQRDDYETKKARCVEIIEQLRVLEKEV